MTFKSCWRSLVHGKWNQNRLLSRKWALVVFVVATAIGLDVAGRALADSTLSGIRDILIAYLAVQGALDWGSKRRNTSKGPDDQV